jgi:hypothetical protein
MLCRDSVSFDLRMVLADVKGLAWDVRKHPNADCGSDRESTLHEARHKLGRQRLTPWETG